MKKAFVYEIKNDVNEVIYVGKTTDPARRWNEHINAVLDPLHRAMFENGIEHFRMEIVEEIVTGPRPTSSLHALAFESEGRRMRKRVREGVRLYNTNIPKQKENWTGKVRLSHGRWSTRWFDHDRIVHVHDLGINLDSRGRRRCRNEVLEEARLWWEEFSKTL